MTRAARLGAASVPLLALLFALVYGLRYGVHNQHTYLLRAARQAQPQLFARDWLVAQATDYHPAFSRLAGLLLAHGGPWAIAVANFVVLAAAALLFHRLARESAGARALPAFLLTIGWAAFAAQHEVLGSVAVSALFANYFVPANLGSLGLLAAIVLQARGRFAGAGACAALGGLFHANYLVLAPPLFLLAHLVAPPERSWRAMAVQMAPCALVLLLRLPELLAMRLDPQAAAGSSLFMALRSPHHYVPLSFVRDFAAFFGWQLLGFTAIRAAGSPATPAVARLRGVFVSVFVMVSAATLLTTAVQVPAIAQLYVWRLAPFGVLLALACLAAWLTADPPSDPGPSRTQRVLTVALLAAAMLGIAWRAEPRVRWALAMLFVTAATGLARWPPGRRAQAVGVLGAVLLALGSARGLPGLTEEAVALGQPLSREERLYEWARTTATDAVFAIPPDLDGFRLSAERAVVVDWKSTPVLPSEVVEWHRRLLLVAGRDAVADLDAAVRGYQTMGPWRIARLREQAGADYVVLRSPFPRTRLPEYPVPFADRRFIVFDVRQAAPLPARER